jgi:hypothetical protein
VFTKAEKRLEGEKIGYYSSQFKLERELSCIIKGIPPSADLNRVKKLLEKAGFK